MELSIIIPVYNVEKTLRRCVESVLRQSFQNFEMILVDDGSTDNSTTMVDEIARTDNRISVIHQCNQGLSAARNTGIKAAKGEYITFIDSDDFIAQDTYKGVMDLLNAHPEYDILEFSVIEIIDGIMNNEPLAILPFDESIFRLTILKLSPEKESFFRSNIDLKRLGKNKSTPLFSLYDIFVTKSFLSLEDTVTLKFVLFSKLHSPVPAETLSNTIASSLNAPYAKLFSIVKLISPFLL
mgnify:CR=1 FL=1